jgi:hypothetical protein
MRHRIPRATYPNPVRVAPLGSYLVLLRAGFTLPQTVASCAVRSYRTISPLPASRRTLRRFAFCCTFRRLAPPRRYLALYPVEPGLSSPMHRTTLERVIQLTPERLSGRLRAATVTARKKKCKRHAERNIAPDDAGVFVRMAHKFAQKMKNRAKSLLHCYF